LDLQGEASPDFVEAEVDIDELGEKIYDLVCEKYEDEAPVITGMLLQLSVAEIQALLADPKALEKAADGAHETIAQKKMVQTPPAVQSSPSSPSSSRQVRSPPVQSRNSSGIPPHEEGDPVLTLFVGGLKPIHNEENLRGYFGRYGQIELVQFPLVPKTQERAGYAFIHFQNSKSVEDAVQKEFHRVEDILVTLPLILFLRHF